MPLCMCMCVHHSIKMVELVGSCFFFLFWVQIVCTGDNLVTMFLLTLFAMSFSLSFCLLYCFEINVNCMWTCFCVFLSAHWQTIDWTKSALLRKQSKSVVPSILLALPCNRFRKTKKLHAAVMFSVSNANRTIFSLKGPIRTTWTLCMFGFRFALIGKFYIHKLWN